MKEHSFESGTGSNFTIVVETDYRDGTADLYAEIDQSGENEDFDEMDGGSVDEIFSWLKNQGMTFTPRALYYAYSYIQSVILDKDATAADIQVDTDEMSDKDLQKFIDDTF